jgi:hypothetical protein
MKTKASPSQSRKTPAIITCLDDHAIHCGRLKTLAGLLALCQESGCSGLDPKLVGGTGALLLRELEELDHLQNQLWKELGK